MGKNNITIIGCGNMGGAIAQGLLARAQGGWNICVYDPHLTPEHSKDLENSGVKIAALLNEAVASSDAVIIAVKPRYVLDLTKQLAEARPEGVILISVAAAVSTDKIQAAVSEVNGSSGNFKFVRVMPNLAVAVGEGVSGIYSADPSARLFAKELFSQIGDAFFVEDEQQIEIVTALCGCGPGFLCYMLEALAAGAKNEGLMVEGLEKIAVKVASGTAKLLSAWKITPEELRSRITTPGGSTAAGVEVLEQERVGAAIAGAVKAATAKGRGTNKERI